MTTLVLPTDAPIVTGPPQGRWTYLDWEMLPHEENRYEIIDGVLYVSKSPSYFHQWIDLQLVRLIAIPAQEQGLAYSIFAPIGVLMPGCDPAQPDFAVVLASRAAIIHDRHIHGVPDLIVEILSPSNHAYDEQVKLEAYARAGVPEYGIIDPRTRTLRHYRLAVPSQYATPHVFGEQDEMCFDCLPTISVPVGGLFAGSPDTTL